MNFKFIFMSIIVLGLIVNTSSFSDFAFAGQSDKEDAKEAREQAKEDREKIREDAKEAREQAKEDREKIREDAKEAREQAKEDTKEFRDGVDVTSSSLSGSEKVTICHIPPGNPANAHTITVGSPAVPAH
jgi:sRNA-binding protein